MAFYPVEAALTLIRPNVSKQAVGPGAIATFLSYQLGIFHHFNMATFLASDFATGSESLNTFAPTGGAINFTPIANADVAAGAKYAVLTAKHQDGFCLWPSAQTSHTIAGTTWYTGAGNQNVAQAFVTACHNAGLKAGFYFSILDLNWQNANPGYTAAQFTAFVLAQINELAAYAPDIIWFDRWEDTQGFETVTYATIYNAIKAALPSCLVIVNNGGNSNPGVANQFDTLHGDVTGWEVDAGGMPPANNVIPGEAAETATSNGNWFWHSPGPSYKSAATIAADQVTANSRNANLLVNVPINQAGALDTLAVSILAGLPAAVFAATPVPVQLAVPTAPLTANQFLRGPVSGAAAIAFAGYMVDADFQMPGLHVPLTNQGNTFTAPQVIQSKSADNIGAILNLQKRGSLGNVMGAVASGALIAQVIGQGWNTSAFAVGPLINFSASETWTPTANGSNLQFQVVKTGTLTRFTHTLFNDGSVFFANGATIGSTGIVTGVNTVSASGGTNPLCEATDGTVTAFLQVLNGSSGKVGTLSNHPFSIVTNNTAVINFGATGGIGFFGGTAAAKPTVSGAKGSNAALASLMSALVALGLVNDSTGA